MGCTQEEGFPVGEYPPLPARTGPIRMTPPDGAPIPMSQFVLGDHYGPLEFARDCGCLHCARFLEKWGPKPSDDAQALIAAAQPPLEVRVERWLPSDD